MKRLHLVVSFVSGLIFAAGFPLSGMGKRSKVIGFLDFTGDWDPSLMVVMGGALGVHLWFAQRALRATKAGGRPLLADAFHVPTSTRIDARLVGGATLFGLGWGLSGYCPGAALVLLPSLAPTTFAFFAAMSVGIVIASRAETPTLMKDSTSATPQLQGRADRIA